MDQLGAIKSVLRYQSPLRLSHTRRVVVIPSINSLDTKTCKNLATEGHPWPRPFLCRSDRGLSPYYAKSDVKYSFTPLIRLRRLTRAHSSARFSNTGYNSLPRRPTTPCRRPRWRRRELGANEVANYGVLAAAPAHGDSVSLNTILPPPDGEHPQFADAVAT
jgi:hypothetical protein